MCLDSNRFLIIIIMISSQYKNICIVCRGMIKCPMWFQFFKTHIFSTKITSSDWSASLQQVIWLIFFENTKLHALKLKNFKFSIKDIEIWKDFSASKENGNEQLGVSQNVRFIEAAGKWMKGIFSSAYYDWLNPTRWKWYYRKQGN